MLNFLVAVFEALILISVWRFVLCFLAGAAGSTIVMARFDEHPWSAEVAIALVVAGATLGFVWERRAERDAGSK
jgi:hypothetical protein